VNPIRIFSCYSGPLKNFISPRSYRTVMSAHKSFPVFGDPVNVLAAAAETNGKFSIITQTCQPGGGPPPHIHQHEDEWFFPISGNFEIFNGMEWLPLTQHGQFAPRGGLHAFRNAGDSVGTIMALCVPGGLDEYLERISPIQMPTGLEELLQISAEVGITFPLLQPPAPADVVAEVAEEELAYA
jgi:mannose-6-phosphate isomerase-like protein (cupin superfamily)